MNSRKAIRVPRLFHKARMPFKEAAMAEYSEGTVRKHKERGKWQGRIRYRDTPESPWRAKTHVFEDIPCDLDPASHVGEKRAQDAFKLWKEEFKAAHDKELADAERASLLDAYSTGDYVSSYIDTLSLSKQKSTISGYRRMLSYMNDGAPLNADSPEDSKPVTIGDIPIELLTREAIQSWVNDMAERLAPVTARKALTVLKAALKNACRDGRIERNPAEFVESPSMRPAAQNPLDERQQALLLADLDSYTETHPGDPSRLAIKMALLTGMRQGEICALTWSDVDLSSGRLNVRRSIGRDGDAFKSGNVSYYPKTPKTGGSRRDIPIPQQLVDDLSSRKDYVISQCKATKVPFSPGLYVFGSIDGEFMNPHGLWAKWRRIAKRLNLVGLDGGMPKFHDLRHTFATNATKSGMDVKTLSSILGHADASMTLNIYTSADPEAKRAAMDKMDTLYERLSD